MQEVENKIQNSIPVLLKYRDVKFNIQATCKLENNILGTGQSKKKSHD